MLSKNEKRIQKFQLKIGSFTAAKTHSICIGGNGIKISPESPMSREHNVIFSSGTLWSSSTRMAIKAAAPVATVASINITKESLISLGSLR